MHEHNSRLLAFSSFCGCFDDVIFIQLPLQDVLQIISMFASFEFKWPAALTTLYNTFSFANFNLELLAPECSFTVSYSTKWFLTESIPIMLVCTVLIVLTSAKVFQTGQRVLLGRLPTGAVSDVHLTDVCLGIVLTGLYYVYFGKPCCAI
jgi:hypothetical protein